MNENEIQKALGLTKWYIIHGKIIKGKGKHESWVTRVEAVTEDDAKKLAKIKIHKLHPSVRKDQIYTTAVYESLINK